MTHDEAIARGATLTGFEVRAVESRDVELLGRQMLLTTQGLAFGRSLYGSDQEPVRVCIRIDSSTVSRVAATLDWVPSEGVVLTDWNNANGVWVGTERLQPSRVMQAGERFRISSFVFELVATP